MYVSYEEVRGFALEQRIGVLWRRPRSIPRNIFHWSADITAQEIYNLSQVLPVKNGLAVLCRWQSLYATPAVVFGGDLKSV